MSEYCESEECVARAWWERYVEMCFKERLGAIQKKEMPKVAGMDDDDDDGGGDIDKLAGGPLDV